MSLENQLHNIKTSKRIINKRLAYEKLFMNVLQESIARNKPSSLIRENINVKMYKSRLLEVYHKKLQKNIKNLPNKDRIEAAFSKVMTIVKK